MKKFETSELPTHVALTASRFNVLGCNGTADSFLSLTYVFESFLKSVVVALRAGIATRHNEHAYEIGYQLVRADGLGTWEQVLRQATTPPFSGFVPSEMSKLVHWATGKRTKLDDKWAKDALSLSLIHI